MNGRRQSERRGKTGRTGERQTGRRRETEGQGVRKTKKRELRGERGGEMRGRRERQCGNTLKNTHGLISLTRGERWG